MGANADFLPFKFALVFNELSASWKAPSGGADGFPDQAREGRKSGFYNLPPMSKALLTTALLAAAPAFVSVSALAQAVAGQAAPVEAAAPHPGVKESGQRVEHLRVEDGGSRIDEVRVGGQTRSISVQPKVTQLPAYDVRPARQGQQQGDRVWKIGNF